MTPARKAGGKPHTDHNTDQENHIQPPEPSGDQNTLEAQGEQITPREGDPPEPWQEQLGWQYLGHGDWAGPEKDDKGREHGNPLVREPDWVLQWLNKEDADIHRHYQVCQGGYPNRWGAKVELEHRWSLDKLAEYLEGYEDTEIVEWLRYGWPAGRLPTLPEPGWARKNHAGATEFPEALDKYISKEASRQAVMGPYNKIPFHTKVGISPLSTRPKKGSQERRVILDLSFPIGQAVNDGMVKDQYLGFPAKLTFPKVDELAFRIYQLGTQAMMFKVDLSRYFRQVPLDPGDYALIGYVIGGQIYFDKVMPMGMRTAPYVAQRISNALAYIHRTMKFFILNYVDDFVGAELRGAHQESIYIPHNTVQRTQGGDITRETSTTHHQARVLGHHLRLPNHDHGNI